MARGRTVVKKMVEELDVIIRKYIGNYQISGAELIGSLELLKSTWTKEIEAQTEDETNDT